MSSSAPYFGMPMNQNRPVQLLDPPMQDHMYAGANTSMQPATDFEPMSDKLIDEPAIEESALFSDVNSMDRNPSMYLGSQRKGIWLPEDRRAFQNQNCLMQILRILLFILVFGVILALCVIMLIFIFLRPPNIGFNDDIQLPQSQQQLDISVGHFSVPANLSFVVRNPNYVPAKINNISALAYDNSEKTTSIGTCNVAHQTIHARDDTTVTLPCKLEYDLNKDSHLSILKDIASRCFKSNKKLQLLLKVHVNIQLYSFKVPFDLSPVISISCPISKNDIKKLSDKADIDDLINGLNSRRSQSQWLALAKRFYEPLAAPHDDRSAYL